MFLKQMQDLKWLTACNLLLPYSAMTVDVMFTHKQSDCDETEFCISAWDAKELSELFEEFCRENGYEEVCIESITIVRVAESVDALAELEESAKKNRTLAKEKECSSAEELKKKFMEEGWGKDTTFKDLTLEEAKKKGYLFAVRGISEGKRYYKMERSGNIYDQYGKLVLLNVNPTAPS